MNIEVNHDEARLISYLLLKESSEAHELMESSEYLETPMPSIVYRALLERTRTASQLADRFAIECTKSWPVSKDFKL